MDSDLLVLAKNLREGKAETSLQRDARNAHQVVQAMIEDGEAVLDRARLMQHVRNFGLAFNDWQNLNNYTPWYNSTPVGLLQIPTELVDFLLYAARYRPASMVEIGVYTGGTTLISAAFFKALNKEFRMTVVDVQDYLMLLPETLRLLDLDIRIPSTSETHHGTSFDVVFIDGNHSYEWAKRDFINLGQHARHICGFHDVNAREYRTKGGGVFRYWRELRGEMSRQCSVYEISHARQGVGREKDGDWMGIGVIDFGSGSGSGTAG